MFPNATHNHMTDDELFVIFVLEYLQPIIFFLSNFHKQNPLDIIRDAVLDELGAGIVDRGYFDDNWDRFIDLSRHD